MDEQDRHALEALKVEQDFLAGVEAKFERAKGTHFRGSYWETNRDDEVEVLRAALARHHRTDHRERLRRMPHNRRVTVCGRERTWWFGRRPTGRATASVLSPLEHYAGDHDDAPRVDLAELREHLRKIVGDAKVPHLVGVCAPSGFTEAARQLRMEQPNVMLVLTEPDGSGGWKVTGATDGLPDYALRMFDPEATDRKIERVRAAVREHSADLLTGGLSVAVFAERLDLPEHLVEEAFAREAVADAELRLSKKSGEVLLYRGASAVKPERGGMDVFERIKQLFSGEANDTEKINALSERRARLAQRRDRIYEDIGRLEKKEADLLEEGRQTSSQIARRRLAAQLAQLRKDIARQNTTANMLNQQINILSTDVHNLTLIQQGQVAELPNTEALTENAVKAEEMLESLKADAEMVSSLETGLNEALTGDEELAILQEFEQADRAAAAPAAPEPQETVPAESTSTREAAPGAAGDDAAQAPPAPTRGEKADPEAG